MKPFPRFAFVAVSTLAFLLQGCGKKSSEMDASQPLAESFQAAEPEVKRSIETASADLKSKNYLAAARAMAPVLASGNLTDPQKEAIALALSQMNRAVAADPALDSKELYELRAKMFQAMRGKSRF